MSSDSQSPTDEAGSVPLAVDANSGIPKAARGFLKTATRDLSEEELASPAARRFLIAEIERLDKDCDDLRQLRIDHGALREKYARLDEKAKRVRWVEILSTAALSAGSVGIGAAPSFVIVNEVATVGWIILACSLLLAIAGIASRFSK